MVKATIKRMTGSMNIIAEENGNATTSS